jgi:hypothetical protein
MGLRRHFAQSSALVLAGAFLQRLTPIILGAILVRFNGHEALAVQNSAYVAFAVSSAFTSSGLVPFVVGNGGAPENDQSPWSFAIALFHILFVLYCVFASLFDFSLAAGSPLLPLIASYIFNVFQLHLAHLHSRKQYWKALVLNVSYAIGAIALVCAALYGGLSNEHSVYGGYVLACSGGVLLALVFLGPAAKITIWQLHWEKSWLWQTFFYCALSVLTVGATFLAFTFFQKGIGLKQFNQLIFSYQLFSFIIFIPGLLTPVVVPFLRDLSRSGGSMPKPLAMVAAYGAFGIVGAATAALALQSAAGIYGIGELTGLFDHYCILLAAIPSSMIASLNQLNIFEKRPQIPFAGAMASSLALFVCLKFIFPLEEFGRALLIAASFSFLVSLLFRLSSRALPGASAA